MNQDLLKYREATSGMLRRGISAIEALVGVSIAAVVIISLIGVVVGLINTGADIVVKTQALYLAEEGLEATRFIRDSNFADISSLTPDTDYYFEFSTTGVMVTTTPETIEGFDRSFQIAEVCRDDSGTGSDEDDIIPCGSSIDPLTFLVTVSVEKNGFNTVTLQTYLAYISDS